MRLLVWGRPSTDRLAQMTKPCHLALTKEHTVVGRLTAILAPVRDIAELTRPAVTNSCNRTAPHRTGGQQFVRCWTAPSTDWRLFAALGQKASKPVWHL